MEIIREEEAGRGGGNFALLDNITMCGRVGVVLRKLCCLRVCLGNVSQKGLKKCE